MSEKTDDEDFNQTRITQKGENKMKKTNYVLVGIILILSSLLFMGQTRRRDLQIIYPEQNRNYRVLCADLLNNGYDLKFVYYGEKGQTGMVFVR
tara:strand:- start:2085 stop:2366 length:282 start_codon:yes stop_codon:yes gene_type:complete